MDEQQQVEDIVKCSDCGSRSLTRDETRGEVVCDDCHQEYKNGDWIADVDVRH